MRENRAFGAVEKMLLLPLSFVIPAKAGIQTNAPWADFWIPAFVGMTTGIFQQPTFPIKLYQIQLAELSKTSGNSRRKGTSISYVNLVSSLVPVSLCVMGFVKLRPFQSQFLHAARTSAKSSVGRQAQSHLSPQSSVVASNTIPFLRAKEFSELSDREKNNFVGWRGGNVPSFTA